jgi:hypothetical protein
MPVHEVVDMVAMGDGGMSAVRAVHVTGFVPVAGVVRRAALGVFLGNLQHAFVGVTFMRMVQVAVVQVIDMIAVDDAGMAAAGAVDVGMVLVDLVFFHEGFGVLGVFGTDGYPSGSLAWASALTTNSATCWSASA